MFFLKDRFHEFFVHFLFILDFCFGSAMPFIIFTSFILLLFPLMISSCILLLGLFFGILPLAEKEYTTKKKKNKKVPNFMLLVKI